MTAVKKLLSVGMCFDDFKDFLCNLERLKKEQNHPFHVYNIRPNTKHVKRMIEKKYGIFVTLKDIHNLKTRMKNGTCGQFKDAQLLLEALELTLRNDSSSAGGVIVNDNNTLEVYYYQSGLMKCLFKTFPEIMLINATYNVNRIGMPLYCFMIKDNFGCRRVVNYAVTTEEDTSHLRQIVQSFKSENLDWDVVHVIVVDKDSPNEKCLRRNFLVQLSYFVNGM